MGCWMLLVLLLVADCTFKFPVPLRITRIEQDSENFDFDQLPPCFDWSIVENILKKHFTFVNNLTLDNAAMVLSQFCISHFVGKKNISILLIYLFAPEAKWRRDTQKTTTPTWLQEVCEIWWWCGSVALSHSCERSRRNGGRWWSQVRERWCGCFRNLPHAGDCVNLVQPISSSTIASYVIFFNSQKIVWVAFQELWQAGEIRKGSHLMIKGRPCKCGPLTGLVRIEELRVVEDLRDIEIVGNADNVFEVFLKHLKSQVFCKHPILLSSY